MTPQELKQILPMCRDTATWSRHLALAEAFGVNTPGRWAAFIAQVGHESAQLTRLVENLSYSVRGLMATWPTRFPNTTATNTFARNPERLANFVYGKRLGNGPMETGDGWRYRGRGLIQVTGKANYQKMGEGLGLDLLERPALLELPDHAVRSAAYFWQSNGMNELADDGTEKAFKEITRRINGGFNGYDDRAALWAKAKVVLRAPEAQAA
jgi:putative chitinase